MLELEDKGGRPDRNQPDQRLREGAICIIYGYKDPLTNLNGLQAYIEKQVYRAGNLFFTHGEVWYACSVYGIQTVVHIREDHLMLLDDSDTLVIEKMMKDK